MDEKNYEKSYIDPKAYLEGREDLLHLSDLQKAALTWHLSVCFPHPGSTGAFIKCLAPTSWLGEPDPTKEEVREDMDRTTASVIKDMDRFVRGYQQHLAEQGLIKPGDDTHEESRRR